MSWRGSRSRRRVRDADAPHRRRQPGVARAAVRGAVRRAAGDGRRRPGRPAAGRRVIAVGTTVVRALETAADADGRVIATRGWTDLVITPERGVRVVDGLLTGFHEPEASHLAMLAAIAGRRPPGGGVPGRPRRPLPLARVRRPPPDPALSRPMRILGTHHLAITTGRFERFAVLRRDARAAGGRRLPRARHRVRAGWDDHDRNPRRGRPAGSGRRGPSATARLAPSRLGGRGRGRRVRRAAARGVAVHSPPESFPPEAPTMRIAFLRDPDGNLLELVQPLGARYPATPPATA